MKYTLSIILSILFMFSLLTKTSSQNLTSLYEIDVSIKSIDGEIINLSSFKGKKVLFVNVASKCGFTPQYKGLQELSDKFKNKLVVIGLPCNQFGNQEPGTSSEIVTFCEKNYGVKFLITEKIEVKGDGQHLLYKWLTNKNMNGKVDFGVKWNFQKYLIDEDGKMIDYFMSNTKPLSEKIVEIL